MNQLRHQLGTNQSLMTYKINLNNHQRVEENKKSIVFMALTNDDEEKESENEDLDLITKKFMKFIKLEKIKKGRKFIQEKNLQLPTRKRNPW